MDDYFNSINGILAQYSLRLTYGAAAVLAPYGRGVLVEYDGRENRFIQYSPPPNFTYEKQGFDNAIDFDFVIDRRFTRNKTFSLFYFYYYYRNIFSGKSDYTCPSDLTEDDYKTLKIIFEALLAKYFLIEGWGYYIGEDTLVKAPLILQEEYNQKKADWQAHRFDQKHIELP